MTFGDASRSAAPRGLLPLPRPAVELAVVVASILVGLIVAEAGLRLAVRHSVRLAHLVYVPQVRTHFENVATTAELLRHSALGHHPLGRTPGFILSSRGFRTHEYRDRKEAGSLRVVVLGDSFAFDSHGVPIRRMWHQVFGRALSKELGRDVEVISLSAPGVGPRFLLRLWELEGQRLSPDLVVLAFFVGNDFTDESGIDLEVGLHKVLVRWSLLVRLVRNVARLHRAGVPTGTAPPEPHPPPDARGPQGGYELPGYEATYDPTAATFERAAYLELEQARVSHFAGPPDSRFERIFSDTALVIDRMAREVELAGARFLVMIIPDEAQVDDRLWSEVERRFPSGTRLDRDRPQRRLRELFRERGIPFLSLLGPMRDHEAVLYKPRDTHWNALGNEMAGAALAEFVVERQLLPMSSRDAGSPQGP